MGYLEIFHLSKEPQLLERLVPAVAQTCVNIYTENAQTANHNVRVALVAYAGPRREDFLRFASEIALLLCVLNPTMTVSTADASLVTMLTSIWTSYALILQSKGLITAAP